VPFFFVLFLLSGWSIARRPIYHFMGDWLDGLSGSASTLSGAVFLSGPSAAQLPIGPFVGDRIDGLPQLRASLSAIIPIGKGKQPYVRGSIYDG
jgi:hypothetical protein